MLASDTDTLTAGDFASRATWADKYRNNLHAYWDVNVVVALGQSAAAIADRLDAHLNAADLVLAGRIAGNHGDIHRRHA